MTLELVLSIIDETLKLANKAVDAMSPADRQKFMGRHERRMERWEAIVDKLSPQAIAEEPS